MHGRRVSLPALLALSVAAALGGGTFALASRTPPPSSATTSSWECSAGLHQDWRCSPGVGQPYTKSLEKIGKHSKTMRKGLEHLMSEAMRKSQEELEEWEEEEEDLIPDYPDDPVLRNLPNLPKRDRPGAPLSGTIKSMADQDWVSRLTSLSSWPQDQRSLPKRPEEPVQDSSKVTEEEVSRSVLLSDWLKRAQKKASWINSETTDEPASELVGTRVHVIKDVTDSPEEEPFFDRQRRLYADDWIENTENQTSWAELEQEKKVPPPDRSFDSLINGKQPPDAPPEDERANKDMKLVGSITLGERPTDAPLVAKIPGSTPLLPSEKKQRPRGLGYSLLAHQASSPSQVAPEVKSIVPPVSVQLAQQRMPAFQMQLKQAQRQIPAEVPPVSAPVQVAPQVVSPPRVIQPGSLPDLEVTPAERLYKAAPQPAIPSSRPMPWQRHATPEQWQHAPSGTRMPETRSYPQAPAVFATADNINLPNAIQAEQALPPSPQTETAQQKIQLRSWSLKGQSMAQVVPAEIITPVPDRVHPTQQPEPEWPEPRYKAGERLAPSLPAYTSKATWPGMKNNQMLKQVQPEVRPNTLRNYRRPPPVSPKDIYRIATEEPPSAGRREYRKETPFTTSAKLQPKGPSSVDRLREKTNEPSAYLDLEPPRMEPAPLPRVMTGLQQVSIASQPRIIEQASVDDMLTAPSGSVSIQWLATTQPGKIYRLQQRYPLLEEATVVRFNSRGQTWHLLLTGVYPDMATARQALNSHEWKTIAKRLNPWTRPLSGLKKLEMVRTDQTILLSQNSRQNLPQGAYTIQWMQAENPEVLRNVREYYPQLSSAEIVMLSRKTGVQYVLIQGRFQNSQAVARILNQPQFQSLTKRLRPKSRPMASLKNSTQLIKRPVFTQVSLPMDRQTSNILMAPEGSYTIQWLAANQPQMLKKLQHRYPVLKSAQTVHFRRDERDWYVLVQGQYSSPGAAQQALNRPELQQLATKLRPWARSVSGLRQVAGS